MSIYCDLLRKSWFPNYYLTRINARDFTVSRLDIQIFLEFNLFLIITALVTQSVRGAWKIDHLAHAQVLEKGESEHSPHFHSVSHLRWDVSQIDLFLQLLINLKNK